MVPSFPISLYLPGLPDKLCGSREGDTEEDKGVRSMAKKEIFDKISIYVPQSKQAERPVQRLIKLSEKKDRSINYLVVEAILQYLKREEAK